MFVFFTGLYCNAPLFNLTFDIDIKYFFIQNTILPGHNKNSFGKKTK